VRWSGNQNEGAESRQHRGELPRRQMRWLRASGTRANSGAGRRRAPRMARV